jgi:hypothetical protein
LPFRNRRPSYQRSKKLWNIGVMHFISLYWRSDNFYLIVLEEWQFLSNCFGGVTIFI